MIAFVMPLLVALAVLIAPQAGAQPLSADYFSVGPTWAGGNNPTVSQGAAAPTAAATDGSVYLQAVFGGGALWQRINGAWTQIAPVGAGLDVSNAAITALGGTVSAVVKNSVTLATASPTQIPLLPGETVTVTYSSAPTAATSKE